MDRRDFIIQAGALGLGCALAGRGTALAGETVPSTNAASAAQATSGEKVMNHKVIVTVIDKKVYPELQKQYCSDPNSGPCPCYNVGDNAFSGSTLLKKVKANPNNPSIRDEFERWIYAGGRVSSGLVNRREAEADMYFGEY